MAYGPPHQTYNAASHANASLLRATARFPQAPARVRGAFVNASVEPGPAKTSWPDLVERLRAGEQSAMEDLYRVFSDGIRLYLWRHLGAQDLTDRVHDLFLTVTESIQSGELREPERLMGYVRTVVRRQVAGHIHAARQQRRNWFSLDFTTPLQDRRPSAEHRVIRREYHDVALRLLASMRHREREVLVRYYLKEQPAADICNEMQLTRTQFRLLKSRAKAKLGRLCKGRLRVTV